MIPLYGQGFFHLALDGTIWYTIIFDYLDREKTYYKLVRRGGPALESELSTLRSNMQKLMDEERVVINGVQVKPVVERAFIEVRSDPARPSVVFITRMNFKPLRGRNVYEDFYEATMAEYDYTVTWVAPPCVKFEQYEGPGEYSIYGSILRLSVGAGTKIKGYESLVFDMTNCYPPGGTI